MQVLGSGRFTSRRNPMRGTLLIALIGLATDPVGAQTAELRPLRTPKSMLADKIVMQARGTLSQGAAELTDDQRQMTRILLDQALELYPRDEAALRLRLELARDANDTEGQIAVLKRYRELVPDDDVAHLDYVRLQVERAEALDERMQKVAQVLDGPEAEALTEPLRSRLASYCARAAFEIGDRAGFKKRLVQALDLDKTNIEAAQMLYDDVAARGLPPYKEALALMYCVRAEPLTVEPRRRLAEILLAEAHFLMAASQFNFAHTDVPEPLDRKFYHDWALALASCGSAVQTQDALRVLGQFERAMYLRSAVKAREDAEAAEAAEADVDEGDAEEEQPTVSHLPLELELLRLAILHHLNLESDAMTSFTRIRIILTTEHAADPNTPMDIAWLSAWLGPGAPTAIVQPLEATRGVDHPVVQRIHGWTALRDGRLKDARRIFSRLPAQDPFAVYGLAQTYADPKDPDRAKHLQRLIRNWPGTLAAMLSARDLFNADMPIEPTEAGEKIVKTLESLPGEIRSPSPGATPWTHVAVDVVPALYGNFEPITARVTLRNTSNIPLAIEPNGTIPAQLFVYISPVQSGKPWGTLPPIVVDLRRRLRLAPAEQFTVEVRLDRGDFGIGLSYRLHQMVEFNATAILDPIPTADGTVSRGVLGASNAKYHLKHIGNPMREYLIDPWIALLDDPSPINRMAATSLLHFSTVPMTNRIKFLTRHLDRFFRAELEIEAGNLDAEKDMPNLSPDDVQRLQDEIERLDAKRNSVGEMFNERFARMRSVQQAWVVYSIPQPKEYATLFATVHELAGRSKDPIVRVAYLARHVRRPGPDLDAALKETNPQILEFAEALKVRMVEVEKARKKPRR